LVAPAAESRAVATQHRRRTGLQASTRWGLRPCLQNKNFGQSHIATGQFLFIRSVVANYFKEASRAFRCFSSCRFLERPPLCLQVFFFDRGSRFPFPSAIFVLRAFVSAKLSDMHTSSRCYPARNHTALQRL
jgi:hypothetical protein